MRWLRHNLVPLVVALILISGAVLFRVFGQADHGPDLQTGIARAQETCARGTVPGGSKENCYAGAMRQVALDFGGDYAFQVLTQLQKNDPDLLGCHLIAHGIGRGVFERDPTTWQTDIRTISSSCNYGAIHGVIESYLLSQPNHSLTRDVIPTICGVNPRADCNHIIGHLTLVETEGDVPKALDLCGVFKADQQQLDFCYTGVFMEYQTALNLIDHGFAPDSWHDWAARVPELEKMCRAYAGAKAIACWTEIVHAALVKFHNDPQKIFDFCNTSQEPEGARRCRRHSLGIMAAAHNFNLEIMKPACDLPQKDDPDFKQYCYNNLVSSLLSTIPQAVPQAIDFCVSIPEQYKASCFMQLSGNAQANPAIDRQQIASLCQVRAPQYLNQCTGPAQQPAVFPRND